MNYVTLGERNLPMRLVDRQSIRGNIEQLADGTHLQTDLITNPGLLISAHLANEEIRQRGFENKKNADLSQSSVVGFQQFIGIFFDKSSHFLGFGVVSIIIIGTQNESAQHNSFLCFLAKTLKSGFFI